MNKIDMSTYSCSQRGESEWKDVDCRDELLMPILEERHDDKVDVHKPSFSSIWHHVLCGLPIGLALPMSVRAFVQWLVNHITAPPPSALHHWIVSAAIYALAVLVLFANIFYLYVVLTKRPAARDVNATFGIMIGFSGAWVMLDVVWFSTIDMMPLVLMFMYTFAYCKFQHKQKERDPDCSMV